MALIFSAVLLIDRIKWHWWETSDDSEASRHRRFYLRLIHILQCLLHALSDNQLVSGLALLVTLNNQACSISAYHYNLVCTMLILSTITHLQSLISIQDYIHKGRIIATFRIIAISTQYVLCAIVLNGRNTHRDDNFFPSKATSFAIMPAACFLNMNATSFLGFDNTIDTVQNITSTMISTNFTTNASTLVHDLDVATGGSEGFWEYILLVAFLAISCVFLLAEWFHASQSESSKSKSFG